MTAHYSRSLSRMLALVVGLGLGLSSGLAGASFTPPTNLGRPGNREGAATRGACKVEASDTEPDLTAIVPVSNIGLTTAMRPTLYWYLPANNYQEIQFSLYQSKEDNTETLIYDAQLPLAGRPRLDSITLDGKVAPLIEGVDYRWVVSLICNPNDPDPSQVRYVEGWVRRVTPSANLSQVLSTATPLQQFEILAEKGLWYDALTTLVEFRQKQPTSSEAAAKWAELMNAQSVRLNRLSQQPQAAGS